MSVSVQVLFPSPQHELASVLQDKLSRCVSVSIVAGFVTVEGVKAIERPLLSDPAKLKNFVAGAGTFRAYSAFDRLIDAGALLDHFHVHLGHSRSTGPSATHRFYRYHPMLHSKIYLFDMGEGKASAFVGSHNVTGFALLGLNGEAGVLIEGPASSPQIAAVQQHVEECVRQAVPYQPGMKEAYTWWTTQFIDGLKAKTNDIPRDGENKGTIVILGVQSDGKLPQSEDVIYFEIPRALGRISSLKAEVHIYVFSSRPPSPLAGLNNLKTAVASFWCITEGLEMERGGVELRADWYVESSQNPNLKPAPRPFRPRPSPDMQQVRVRVRNQVFGDFEYLFQPEKASWDPEYDKESSLKAPADAEGELKALELVPPEHLDWFLVRGLRLADPNKDQAYLDARYAVSPDSGAYVLISQRRRDRAASKKKKARTKD